MADSNAAESPASSTPATTTRLFPLYLLWFVLFPALPFFFSAMALQFFVTAPESQPAPTQEVQSERPPAAQAGTENAVVSEKVLVHRLLDIDIEYIKPPQKTLTHLSSLLSYSTTTAIHGIACLIVIGFFLYQIHKLPRIIILRTYLYMAITASAFFALAWVIRTYSNDLILTQLGYKAICMLLSKAELQTALVWADLDGGHTGEACFLERNTRLVWLAYTPIAFGLLTIVTASAFTTVLASQRLPADEKQWRPQFLARIALLQKSFYLASLVLVTSTITILYFTSMPLDLLVDAQFKDALSKLFNGLTAFWGAVFTATLFATFVPAVLLFIRHAHQHRRGPDSPSDLGQWLYEHVFVSIKKQAMNVLVVIAPMLVGPFSELLKNLSGLAG